LCSSTDSPASSGKSSQHRANSWENAAPEDYSNVDKDKIFRALWRFYRDRVRPLEIAYQYEHFEGKIMMTEADFMSKPMVLLLGPYSVGKTSFIRSLIECDFPGPPRPCKPKLRLT
jgi:EH domain-containing protein 1